MNTAVATATIEEFSIQKDQMRIILADHNPQSLQALQKALQGKPEFEIVGEAINADQLMALALTNAPDLVLTDVDLPGKIFEDLIVELHACTPRPIVVVMSSKPENGRRLLNAGADAFLSKSNEPEWLLETLQIFEHRLRKGK
jgi:DNA-binding NarL/FixJ family response regulator